MQIMHSISGIKLLGVHLVQWQQRRALVYYTYEGESVRCVRDMGFAALLSSTSHSGVSLCLQFVSTYLKSGQILMCCLCGVMGHQPTRLLFQMSVDIVESLLFLLTHYMSHCTIGILDVLQFVFGKLSHKDINLFLLLYCFIFNYFF